VKGIADHSGFSLQRTTRYFILALILQVKCRLQTAYDRIVHLAKLISMVFM